MLFLHVPLQSDGKFPIIQTEIIPESSYAGGSDMNTIFIGIAGGTGSGKTTLTEHLVSRFGDDIAVVHHDNYYKRQDRPFAERCLQNYDHPDAFETSLLVEHLKALKAGRSIQCPVYSYVDHNRTDETVEVFPTKVIIVEGIHAFYDARLRAMMDLKLYMHVESDICLLRRIQRDINERGRQIDNISSQYITTVKPMFDQYIRNYEQYADVIVAGGGKDAKITEILAGYINNDLHLYRGLNRRRDEKNA